MFDKIELQNFNTQSPNCFNFYIIQKEIGAMPKVHNNPGTYSKQSHWTRMDPEPTDLVHMNTALYRAEPLFSDV